jgi:hypothetical protein
LGRVTVTACVPNPNLQPRSILLVLAEALGLPATDQHQIMRAIRRATHRLSIARGTREFPFTSSAVCAIHRAMG